jgi:hypothetical protein
MTRITRAVDSVIAAVVVVRGAIFWSFLALKIIHAVVEVVTLPCALALSVLGHRATARGSWSLLTNAAPIREPSSRRILASGGTSRVGTRDTCRRIRSAERYVTTRRRAVAIGIRARPGAPRTRCPGYSARSNACIGRRTTESIVATSSRIEMTCTRVDIAPIAVASVCWVDRRGAVGEEVAPRRTVDITEVRPGDWMIHRLRIDIAVTSGFAAW